MTLSKKCHECGGNDLNMPCGYPSEGKSGCLRDIRLLQHNKIIGDFILKIDKMKKEAGKSKLFYK